LKKTDSNYFIILIVSALLFIPFIGHIHLFDWDEINFAESAREMLQTGNYSIVQINFQPFWEKPPLFIWLQAFSMTIFGVNEFAARFPDAITGIATLLILYSIGKKFFNKSFGLLWVLAYGGSLLPHIYFKSGIIDPVFNLFMFLAVYFYTLFLTKNIEHKKSIAYIFISALFIGLSVLTKGPVGFLIVIMTIIIFHLFKWNETKKLWKEFCLLVISSIAVSLVWFIILTLQSGTEIIQQFIDYQIRLFRTEDAGHGGPFYYHFIILLFGCFPASIFALFSFRKDDSTDKRQQYFKLFMLILLFVVLIIFSIVKTKIVHYSSMCYFPISFLCAYYIYKQKTEMNKNTLLSILIGVIGLAIALSVAIFPVSLLNKQWYIDTIKDQFTKAVLMAPVSWSYFDSITGIIFAGFIIISMVLIQKNKLQRAFITLAFGTILVTQIILIQITPKIEKYTQSSAIEFYQSIASQDCYVEVLGFKSYAQLFYSLKKTPGRPESLDKEWLLHGKIDKPVYFVTKISYNILQTGVPLEKIGEKNGFVFYRRNP